MAKGPIHWSNLFNYAKRGAAIAYTANKNSPYVYGPFGTSLGKRKAIRQGQGSAKRAKKNNTTVTPMGTKRMLRRQGGAVYSKSSGFFKKGASKRQYKKKPLIKVAQTGTNRTIESAKVQSGTNAVWVGHGTFARDNILRQAIISLLYKFLVDNEVIRDALAVDETLGNVLPASTFAFAYRALPTGTGALETYTVPAGYTTLKAIAEWFMDPIRPWCNGGTANYEVQFIELTYTNGNFKYSMLLTDAIVKVFVKSSLKLQNRSKAAAATGENPDDSTSIDNVPLYGKIYSGSGTSLVSKAGYSSSGGDMDLTVDRQFGVLTGSESLTGRSEPPQPREFTNVSNCGKAHLDPGEIKTSILTSSHNHLFNTLYRMCAPFTLPLTPTGAPGFLLASQRKRNFGKFRVFCLEKMIDVGATEPISVAFENNMEISCSVKVIKRKVGVIKEFGRYDLA